MLNVSIIIPAFNIEQYISDCVESIAKQTQCSFEVIIIDDCSKDKTIEVCECLKAKYPFIKLIKLNKNMGVSYCRNIGIQQSKGEYICFLDGDDYYKNDFLSFFYLQSKLNDLDLVRGMYLIEKDGIIAEKRLNKKAVKINGKVIDGLNFLKYTINHQINEVVPWLGLYKTSFLRKYEIEFPLSVSYEEDHLFFLNCLLKAKRTMLINNYFYVYRYRCGSASKTFALNKGLDVLEIVNREMMLATSEKHFEKFVLKFIGSSFYQVTSIFGRITRFDQKELFKAFESYRFKKRHLYKASSLRQSAKNILFIKFNYLLSLIYRLRRR